MNFDLIWNNIVNHQGEIFYTVRNKQFIYKIYDDNLQVSRITCDKVKSINRFISKGNIKKTMQINNPNCTKLSEAGVQGPSYILALIMDKRINANI